MASFLGTVASAWEIAYPRRGHTERDRGRMDLMLPSLSWKCLPFGYTAQVTKPAALVLLALLAASPLVALLPYDTGSFRLLGLSLEWWYCGVVAPVLAVLIAVVSSPRAAPSAPPE